MTNIPITYPEFDFIHVQEPDPPSFALPKNNEAFFIDHLVPVLRDKRCPYCPGIVTDKNLGDRDWPPRMVYLLGKSNVAMDKCKGTLFYCELCGWWSVYQDYRGNENGMVLFVTSVCWSKIKEFDISFAEKPVDFLRMDLAKYPDQLPLIQTKKITDIIASSFHAFYPCEVIPVGGQENAIDTFLVNSDNPVLVRVNRFSDDASNSVHIIQELLGMKMTEGRYTDMHVCMTKRLVDDIICDQGIDIPLSNSDAVLGISRQSGAVQDAWERIWST